MRVRTRPHRVRVQSLPETADHTRRRRAQSRSSAASRRRARLSSINRIISYAGVMRVLYTAAVFVGTTLHIYSNTLIRRASADLTTITNNEARVNGSSTRVRVRTVYGRIFTELNAGSYCGRMVGLFFILQVNRNTTALFPTAKTNVSQVKIMFDAPLVLCRAVE